jgi:hypothetical protein
MVLLVTQTMALNDRMMMNSDMERMWKEMVVMCFLRYCPDICLEGLSKTMKTLSPGQYSKWSPSKYKSNGHLLSPNYFISILSMLHLVQHWTGDLQNVGLP